MEVITTHLNADFDSLAAMVAAKKFYPDAVMAFAGSQEKNIRDYFIQASHYFLDFKRQKQIPLDPWDNEYIFRCPGDHGEFDIISYGADREEGGEGEDQDVVNWKGLNETDEES